MTANETASTPDGDGTRPQDQRAVTVRMYRQGLGDCFLLTFPRQDRPLYMLIDCGVLLGTEDQEQKMAEVAASIRETTGGHIDVLVATHEHWDHLSGFLQAGDVFDGITVGDVWFAWTEDPDDALANKLRGARKAALTALRSAHQRLRAAGLQPSEALQSVLEFSGPLAAAGGGKTIGDALAYVRDKVAKPTFCEPGGEPLKFVGVDGVRIYVLGPPKDEKLIKKSDPTKAGREVYELAATADLDQSFAVAPALCDKARHELDTDELRAQELSLPFDMVHQIGVEAAKAHPFFAAAYYGDGQQGGDEWTWRQIENDWLGASEDLALKLDNDTNNTSLALAIELSPGGDVFLFPGDAQVGNWLSWGKLAWPKGAKPEDAGAITAQSLLARTVLYKVGHHASHNATLRAQGLELMTSPQLIAMIPVDEQMAHKKKWAMPFASLLSRLEERTRGRVIRADRTASALKAGSKPARLTDQEWRTFCDRLLSDAEDRLYIEYRIPLAARAAAA